LLSTDEAIMQAFPKQAKPMLAVTYKCADGHHDIRWWEIPTAIPRDVMCCVCGGVSVVGHDEKQRHKHLHTELERWLV
jgi:hypothetical protein